MRTVTEDRLQTLVSFPECTATHSVATYVVFNCLRSNSDWMLPMWWMAVQFIGFWEQSIPEIHATVHYNGFVINVFCHFTVDIPLITAM